MIIDLNRFVEEGRPCWDELERYLTRLEDDPTGALSLDDAKRFYYLYQRASADLARIMDHTAVPEARAYLEDLVGRAYAECHEARRPKRRFQPIKWFVRSFPRTFRAHLAAFGLSAGLMLLGCIFGSLVVALDPNAKEAIMPMAHLMIVPEKRVEQEESEVVDRLKGAKAQFSTTLMTQNTKVAILTMALGMTWGVGTCAILFYNGIILGAVAADYVLASQTRFLLGWLLPHGSVEIPAILLAGQAGFVLAGAMLARGRRRRLGNRMRDISPDVMTLIGGVAVLLVWAGFVEAFFSQYHEPVIPYSVKIALGVVELIALGLFLARSGRTANGAGKARRGEAGGAPRAATREYSR